MFNASVEMDLLLDAVGTVRVPATKLPSHLILRNRKHGKKSFTERGKKLGVMRGRI